MKRKSVALNKLYQISTRNIVIKLNYQRSEQPYFLELVQKFDSRGTLRALNVDALPFVVSRIFTIEVEKSETIRGQHAHKTCFQAFHVTGGTCQFTIKNLSGVQIYNVTSDQVFVVPPYNWCEIKFTSSQTHLIVLASHLYDENDYIHTEPLTSEIDSRYDL